MQNCVDQHNDSCKIVFRSDISTTYTEKNYVNNFVFNNEDPKMKYKISNKKSCIVNLWFHQNLVIGPVPKTRCCIRHNNEVGPIVDISLLGRDHWHDNKVN